MDDLQNIQDHIYVIRGQRVMLDRDIAKAYGVETKVLNQAVKRNIKRKPRLVRFYKILRKSWRDSCRCWRNLQDSWKKSETLGGFSKCVIGYPSA